MAVRTESHGLLETAVRDAARQWDAELPPPETAASGTVNTGAFVVPPGAREVTLWAWRRGALCRLYDRPLPGCDCLRFAFREITAGLWDALEMAATRPVRGFGRCCDHGQLRLEYLRRGLVAWNLDFPLSFGPDGFLTEAAFEAALRLHPAVVRAITEPILGIYQDDSERREIERQAAVLFGAHQSVPDAHPMVALYCHLEMMWEKFGLNWHDLRRMPAKERNALRQLAGLENSARIQERKNDEMRRNAPRGLPLGIPGMGGR